MKKVLAILMALAMVFAVAACGNGNGGGGSGNGGNGAAGGFDLSSLRIALVAHGPESIQFDGSFNEGAWTGIIQFLAANNLPANVHANFFQSHAANDEARVDVMMDAINTWGANILIMPGFHFAESSYTAANLFPDTMFVVLDTATDPGPTPANVVTILYAEEQSGFLAGYGVVMEGYRQLGFMGGIAVPAVVRFGHGFLEGAEHAARELGLSAGDVTVNYHYIGGFAPNPAVTTMAGSWYAGGTEVIFAAAGGAGFSVIAAAEDAGTWVVGVDVDQSGASDVVLTSAMKALAVSVNDMITDFVNESFRGGSDLLFNAALNGVALPMNNSRFSTFTQAQYDAVYAQLANGSIVVSTTVTPTVAEANLALQLVTLNEIVS
jgi:basic membrane protein A